MFGLREIARNERKNIKENDFCFIVRKKIKYN